MQIIHRKIIFIFYLNYFFLLNCYFTSFYIEAASQIVPSKNNKNKTNIEQQQMSNPIISKKSNLKIPKKSINNKQSSQRLIRQIINEGKKSNEKPKRYKCFLIDEEEGEQLNENKKQQQNYLSKSELSALEQKSYFAGFLKDGAENNFMGLEDVASHSENPRRSEGANSNYLLDNDQNKIETTKTPIIEYIDDYDTPQKEDDQLDLNSHDTANPILSDSEQTSAGWETIPTAQAKFSTTTTKKDTHPSDIKNQNQNSVESSSSLEEKQQREQQIDEDTNYEEKNEKEEMEESEEDFYSDEDFATKNNKIITTTIKTTSKIIKNSKNGLNKIQTPQKNNAIGSLPRAKVFPGLTKIINTQNDNLITTIKPKIQQGIKQQQLKINSKIDEGIKQQLPQNRLREVKMPLRDSQGRPLILAPEHCKMIESYAQLYGASANSVLTFVKNNCAFVKIYLPTASCSEIEILVKSCYDRNVIKRKQKRFL